MRIKQTQGYNVRKAAQVAAFFAQKEGGQIDVLKLVKLVYLSDRENLARYDSPILFDAFVSMQHGPVNSRTYDLIGGYSEEDAWGEFISGRQNHKVGLTKADLTLDDLDELSDAEVEVLSFVWSEFGSLNKWQIRDYTHDHCPEWEDPNGSSEPIPYQRIFKFLGKKNSEFLEAAVAEDRKILTC